MTFAPDGPGPLPEGLVPGREIHVLRGAAELREQRPGLLILPADRLSAETVLEALEAVAAIAGDGWLPLLVEQGEAGDVRARPVSLGWPVSPSELSRWAEGADDADVLELRYVLKRVARGRHDLNNPLTSAMAETQLALMDATDPELRAGLEMIEEQLRRIRDLVAALRALSPPR